MGAQALRANGAAAPSRFSDIQKVVSPWLQRAAQQPPWKTDVPFATHALGSVGLRAWMVYWRHGGKHIAQPKQHGHGDGMQQPAAVWFLPAMVSLSKTTNVHSYLYVQQVIAPSIHLTQPPPSGCGYIAKTWPSYLETSTPAMIVASRNRSAN